VRREEAVEAVDTLVEAFDEDLELVGFGRGPGLVDLDPGGSEVDQRLQIRPDQVAGEVKREFAPCVDLVRAADAPAEASPLRTVQLVVGPDGERVSARDWNLELGPGDRLQEAELVIVVRSP
jgi:hypothetical protein